MLAEPSIGGLVLHKIGGLDVHQHYKEGKEEEATHQAQDHSQIVGDLGSLDA